MMQVHRSKECGTIRFEEKEDYWEQEEIQWEKGQRYVYGVLPCDGKPVHCKKEWCSFIYFEGGGIVEVDECYHCFAGNFLLSKNMEVTVIPEVHSCIWIAMLHEQFVDDLFRFQIADCTSFYKFVVTNPKRPEALLFEYSAEGERALVAQLLRTQLQGYDTYSLKNVRTCFVLYFTLVERVQQKYRNLSGSKQLNEFLTGEILQYMSNHYATATLSSTAKEFNYHPNYFSTLFRKLMQCGFSEKLQQIRIERAALLLASTNLTIEEIRVEIGFEEKSYFYRLFREKYGTTPAVWRKTTKKLQSKNVFQ